MLAALPRFTASCANRDGDASTCTQYQSTSLSNASVEESVTPSPAPTSTTTPRAWPAKYAAYAWTSRPSRLFDDVKLDTGRVSNAAPRSAPPAASHGGRLTSTVGAEEDVEDVGSAATASTPMTSLSACGLLHDLEPSE
jgi:hypothetical protein